MNFIPAEIYNEVKNELARIEKNKGGEFCFFDYHLGEACHYFNALKILAWRFHLVVTKSYCDRYDHFVELCHYSNLPPKIVSGSRGYKRKKAADKRTKLKKRKLKKIFRNLNGKLKPLKYNIVSGVCE